MLFTQNVIDFHSFLCVTLHFIGTGNNMNLTLEPDTNSINVSWINPYEEENCNVNYTIMWKDFTDESRNGSDFTENNNYVIDSLEACVTFEVSVSALCVDSGESETETANVTTLADGKWHVMCRFCTYTTFYSECIQYSHQLKFLLQISYILIIPMSSARSHTSTLTLCHMLTCG